MSINGTSSMIFLVSLVISILSWNNYRKKSFSIKLKYDTFSPRFLEGFVDVCICWPLLVALDLALIPNLAPAAYAAVILMQIMAMRVYNVVMHAKYGQTYGKMVCKVKVVDHVTEGRISVNQALLREGVNILVYGGQFAYQTYWILTNHLTPATYDADMKEHASVWFWISVMIPGIWCGLDALTLMLDRKHRSLHDKIAGTVVIRTNIRKEEEEGKRELTAADAWAPL